MSDDDKDLKDSGEEEKTESGILSDSVLDAFDEAIPVEDETLKDPFDETEREEDDTIPLDSGDYGTSDEW
ncbi:MAG: hypothetical protein WCR40_01720 [Candidatus Paceibacterota bacterium]